MPSLHRSLTAALALSCISHASLAQRANTITLPDAVASALRFTPELHIAAAAIDSARAERRIAGEYPNPTIAGTPNTPYQYSVGIPLDVMPQRRYRAQVADAGIAAAALDRSDATRQARFAVTRVFYDALFADARRSLALQRRAAVAELLRADSARYRAGDVPLRNLGRSEVELARADADVARADADAVSTSISLQSAMGIEHPDTSARAAGELTFRALPEPEDSVLASALASRPDRQAAAQRVAQSRSAAAFARALLLPIPQVSLVRQFGAPFQTGSFYSVGLSFELPSVNRYGGQRQKAQAGLSAAAAVERRSAMQVTRDVQLALVDFRAQRALITRYESGVLDRMTQAVEAARYAYSRGSASLLEVLEATRAEQEVRGEYAQALHDYWVSAHALNSAVGRDVLAIEP
jgi:cobalt-zinc-cadmium efflux system outer membrane protein